MNYKLLLIALLLVMVTITKAEEEEFPSDIDEISDELREIVSDDDDDNDIIDREDFEQMMKQKLQRRRRRRRPYYSKGDIVQKLYLDIPDAFGNWTMPNWMRRRRMNRIRSRLDDEGDEGDAIQYQKLRGRRRRRLLHRR